MKFRKTALAVALTMSLTVLAGCDQSAKKEVPELKATTQETVQTQATGLRTLKHGDENGFYCFSRGDAPGRSKLCYVDYATGTAKPLCEKSDCEADCPACLPLSEHGAEVWVLDENTLVLLYDVIQDGASAADSQVCIDLADRDGSNRRNLLRRKQPEYDAVFIGNMMADSEALYFGLNGEQGGLCRIALDGSGVQQIYHNGQWSVEAQPLKNKLIAVTNHRADQVIYEKNTITKDTPADEVQRIYEESERTPTRWLIAINPTDGHFTELIQWEQEGDTARNFLTDEDRVWWLTQGGEIGWIKLDGTTGVLDVQWPAELKNPEPDMFLNAAGLRIVQGKLLVQPQFIEDEAHSKMKSQYAIDLETGEVAPIAMEYIAYDCRRPVSIVEESEKGLLVIQQETVEKAEKVYGDGTVVDDVYRPSLALISHEDFFNGNPDYQSIQISCDLDSRKWW